MNIRKQLEKIERLYLSSAATFSDSSKGRKRPGKKDDVRMDFQRDRDRIIHSKSFRRLKHKTQVFLAPTGDHYRTRLTHAIEVSQIARTMARSLMLNEDLAEAVSLGHDLGHTPFGHAGEEVLNRLHPKGFEHHIQSLRVVELLENDGRGLNLTWEVRDGIRGHSKGKGPILGRGAKGMPATPEGKLVRLADVIAYTNHDIDDALRAKVITRPDLPKEILKTLGKTHSKRIDTMIRDVIKCSSPSGGAEICMSDEIYEATHELRDYLFKKVYESDRVKEEFDKSRHIVEELYRHFLKEKPSLEKEIGRKLRYSHRREVVDFIAGMTDRYAINLHSRL